MDATEVKMDPCGYVYDPPHVAHGDKCDKMSIPGTDRCFIHSPEYPGMEPVKVKIGQSILILGDDFMVRIFSSGSQPKYPERTYHVLYEDAYGDESMDLLTEAELNERLSKSSNAPHSVEEMLRMANQHRQMDAYSFPPQKPIVLKDV